MHLNSVVFLFLAVSCVYLFSSCDAARQKVAEDKIESTTSRKKIESTSRGSVKYLLPQPTVKNKKFQVTSPPTEEITGNFPTHQLHCAVPFNHDPPESLRRRGKLSLAVTDLMKAAETIIKLSIFTWGIVSEYAAICRVI